MSHVFVSASEFEPTLSFYSAVMETLGIEQRFVERDKPWAGWHSAGKAHPFFVICRAEDSARQDSDDGDTITFATVSRTVVLQVHQTALAHGGICEGPPTLRPEYHANHYGAYFRDPAGNKLCVACHGPLGM